MKHLNKTLAMLGIGAALSVASASAQNMISRYSFNETSGTAVSDSVGGLNGSLQGAAVFNGTGQAVLDGTSGTYISLDPAALSGLTSATLDAWFTYTVGNDNVHLWSIDSGAGTGGSYLRCNVYDSGRDGGMNFVEIGDPTWMKLLGDQVLPADQQIHLSVVYDAANSYEAIYYNGVLENSFSGALPDLSSIAQTAFTLGQSPWVSYGDPNLVGSIDEFRVFDGALSGGQISAFDAIGPNLVPEPTSLVLALGGGLLLLRLRRRN